jgi:hypothetical protein
MFDQARACLGKISKETTTVWKQHVSLLNVFCFLQFKQQRNDHRLKTFSSCRTERLAAPLVIYPLHAENAAFAFSTFSYVSSLSW